MKIKIAFYSHTIDYAGTWRSHERVILNLDRDRYIPYVIYNVNADNNRLGKIKNELGDEFVIPFSASTKKMDANYGYTPLETNFSDVIKKISPDILHFARSGYYEWPFNERHCPIQIETNIFGFMDNTKFIDYSVSISETVKKIRGGNTEVIYNPMPKPLNDDKNLRSELGISSDTIVLGRIGRPDNFTPISIDAAKNLKSVGINFKYIIIGACQKVKEKIKEYKLEENFILYDTTNDDYFIHKFYNTIDIFAHYRSDGETFGTAIAQSMIYGKPVVTHKAGTNGQEEIIGDCGLISNNTIEYFGSLLKLIKDKEYYNELSNKTKLRGNIFLIENTVPKFDKIYTKLYNQKK